MLDVLVNMDFFNLTRETTRKEKKYFVVLLQNCQDYVKREIVSSLLCHLW